MVINDPFYFDYAASTLPFPEALKRYAEVSANHFANPSSRHSRGRSCHEKLMELKKQFCELLAFHDGRLLLCGSGTEANNTIVQGYMRKFPGARLVIAENVHDSIWFASDLYPTRVEVLPLNRHGLIRIDRLKKALQNQPSLVCVSHACNETGVLQPVRAIADLCHFHQVPLLIDGAQTVGHIPVNLDEIPCTYYTFSAHKFGAPKGTGGALIREDTFGRLLHGGRQEWGLRAGTENLAGLAASIEALRKDQLSMTSDARRLNALKKTLLDRLQKSGVTFLENSLSDGLPGFVSLSYPGLSGNEIVTALSLSGFAVSTGAACHANVEQPPRVILAMGRTATEARGTIRITMGRNTTAEAVNALCEALVEFVVP